MNQSTSTFNNGMKRLSICTEALLLSAYQHYALELFIFLVIVFFSFYWTFSHKFPMGYSGLYSLMTEKIIENHFLPPGSINFYGPGKVPFAYPPLGLYINAAVVSLFSMDQFVYLKFFPPVTGIITAIACYLLFRQITKERITASIATLLFCTTSDYISLHIKSDGMVRGPALLFGVLGIYFYYTYLQSKTYSTKNIVLTGLFMGLSFLTHLSYGVFCVLSVILLAIGHVDNFRKRAQEIAVILAISLLISAPWWLIVLRNFGINPFINAMNSHSTIPDLNLRENFLAFPIYPVFYVICLPFWLMKREWRKVIWGTGISILLGESARFVALLGSLALAELFFDLAIISVQSQKDSTKSFVPASLAFLLITMLILSSQYDELRKDKPFLSEELIQVGHWLADHTPLDSKYLFISKEMNGSNEWMPYLARRTPTIGHWGAEWLGDYYKKHEIMSRMIRCSEKDSWECIQRVTKRYTSRPDYIIFFRYEFERLEADINASPNWQTVFQDETMIIYKDTR